MLAHVRVNEQATEYTSESERKNPGVVERAWTMEPGDLDSSFAVCIY